MYRHIPSIADIDQIRVGSGLIFFSVEQEKFEAGK